MAAPYPATYSSAYYPGYGYGYGYPQPSPSAAAIAPKPAAQSSPQQSRLIKQLTLDNIKLKEALQELQQVVGHEFKKNQELAERVSAMQNPGLSWMNAASIGAITFFTMSLFFKRGFGPSLIGALVGAGVGIVAKFIASDSRAQRG